MRLLQVVEHTGQQCRIRHESKEEEGKGWHGAPRGYGSVCLYASTSVGSAP